MLTDMTGMDIQHASQLICLLQASLKAVLATLSSTLRPGGRCPNR